MMRTYGILWVLYGLLRLIGALFVFLYSNTLSLMWGALLTRVPHYEPWIAFFQGFLIFAIILGIVAGIVCIIAGLNLMSGVASARKLAYVAAFFGLTNGPLGIALGAFTLAFLVRADTRNA
ncbi:MAG: hypothetical protein WA211_15645 [Candidatus Acidiferrales bacterium]